MTSIKQEIETLQRENDVGTVELKKQNAELNEQLNKLQLHHEGTNEKMQSLQTEYEKLEKSNQSTINETMQKMRELEEEAANVVLIRSELQITKEKQIMAETTVKEEREEHATLLQEKIANEILLNTKLQASEAKCERLSVQLNNEEKESIYFQNINKVKLKELHAQIAILEKNVAENNNFKADLMSSVSNAIVHSLQHMQTITQESCYTQALKCIAQLRLLLLDFNNAMEHPQKIVRQCILLGQQYAQLQVNAGCISITSADVANSQAVYEDIVKMLLPIEELCFALVNDVDTAQKPIAEIWKALELVEPQLGLLKRAAAVKTELGDLVVNELADMDKAITEATSRFIELLSESRSKDEGIKLEVNGKILDACTALMESIKQLIERARQLQEEIVSTGRGTTSVKEFYKRNSQWSEGLISAAKSVAKGANLLLDSADKATSVETPATREYFHILVAAQEIAAYTAQLVVASKVKAPHDSERLQALQNASRSVSMATGAVVATVRDCNKFLEAPEVMDITRLTSSQAKTMEMEIHVRVLELEQALQLQRLKLSSFRRSNYQNNED